MRHARYLRLFSDPSGESHFEDIDVEMVELDFAPPATPMDFAQLFEAKSSALVAAPSDWDSVEPHPSPRRQLMTLLQGEVEVKTSDGEVRIQRSGEIVLLEDTSGKGHTTRGVGGDDILALVVALQ